MLHDKYQRAPPQSLTAVRLYLLDPLTQSCTLRSFLPRQLPLARARQRQLREQGSCDNITRVNKRM